jgi:hypothetical protein
LDLSSAYSPAEEKPGTHSMELMKLPENLSRQEEAAGIGFGDPKNILEFSPSL